MAKAKKRAKRTVSLFVRYMTFFTLVEVISFAVFGVVLLYFVAGTWEDEQKQTLYDYSVNVAAIYDNVVSPDGAADSDSLKYSMQSMASASSSDIFICDVDGNILYCSDSSSGSGVCAKHRDAKIPGELTTSVAADGILATRGSFGAFFGDDSFVSACAAGASETRSKVLVFVVQPVSVGLKPYISYFLRSYILSALAMLIVMGLIVYYITYNMTRPISEMSQATRLYAKGDFSHRIGDMGHSSIKEFHELSSAMNSMAQSLQKHEEVRSSFVANVSHELKTPMTTIGGFIDGILDGTIDKEHEEHYLLIVSEEVKRLSRLVSSMLNATKLEAGELRINKSRFDLSGLILGILESFEQKINGKNITVTLPERMKSIFITADSDMIKQVFYNLTDNAVKFCPEGGELKLCLENDDETVTVRIYNTGELIDSKDISHLFERFYKTDKSRSLDVNGSGLGLFIVKNIVELHGGSVWVSNEENKYVCFTVKLRIKLTDK